MTQYVAFLNIWHRKGYHNSTIIYNYELTERLKLAFAEKNTIYKIMLHTLHPKRIFMCCQELLRCVKKDLEGLLNVNQIIIVYASIVSKRI